ncbi:hypothetical protein POTOM_047497 [Populus tomentosa]|uniref:Uncharacterized protein n=1 Tax=Populus tomentosa TaxID=118781 RepID=A0A8X8CCB9_POPTO|nr:hypothetical protein POTOM_047497 [Populus tomentosa]
MNISASQYSGSGCESGWTSYLYQSSISKNQYQGFGGFVDGDFARVEDEQEEDLSMVSDASSGPPHYCEDGEFCCDKLAMKSKNKKKSREHGRSQQYSYLDDTASSPALSKAKHVPEFSQGFSATHFKGKSSLKKHLGFFKSSHAEKAASKEPVALDTGERIGGRVKEKKVIGSQMDFVPLFSPILLLFTIFSCQCSGKQH